MRTVTFKSVLHGVAVRMGMDPQTALTNVDARALTEYIKTAFRYAWTFAPWPQVLVTEERAVLDQCVDFEMGGRQVETVLGVFAANPDTAANPRPIPFRLTRDGLAVPAGTAETVWLVFREPPPEWTSEAPADGTTMAVGDTYYEPDDGQCHEVLQAFEYGTDTPAQGTDIRRLEFPAFLAEAVKCGAHALAMQEEGQFATSMMPSDAMDAQLQHEWAIVERQHGQTLRIITQPR